MAGWAQAQTPLSKSTTVVGTTGTSQAFGSNVTAGDVVCTGSLFNVGTGPTATFSDASSNVTTWHPHTFSNTNSNNLQVAVGWGIATATGTCTPKVTWSSASSAIMELFQGDFTAPAGTISEDGAVATLNQTTGGATINAPSANGTGLNDLVFAMVGCGASFSSWTGSWVAMGPSTGDDSGYLLNAAGNSTIAATQSSGSGYTAIVLALQAGSGTTQVFVPHRMPLGA